MRSALRQITAIFALAIGAAALPAAVDAQGQPAPMAGHLIGKQDAPLRLVEYVSYTCPHCAHFESEAGDTLKLAYAQTGKVAIEIRNFVRDPFDLTVAMLANCGAPARFALNHSALLKSQDEWLGRIRNTTPAQRARYSSGTHAARRQAIARDAGLHKIMRTRGYDDAGLDRCLADDAMAKKLAEDTAAYSALGVSGTPSFAINGVLLAGTHDWSMLKPQIDARIRR